MKTFHALNELDVFTTYRDTPRWLAAISKQANTAMNTLEWPSLDDEIWRRTNLSYLDYASFILKGVKVEKNKSIPLPDGYDGVINYIGSELSQELNHDLADQGVIFARLEESYKLPALSSRLSTLLLKELDILEHKISMWHFASITDVYLLYVPKGVKIEKPLMLNIAVGGEHALIAPHVLLLCEDNASCTLLMDVQSLDDSNILYNEYITASIGKSAKATVMSVNTLNLNSTVFNTTSAWVEESSVFDCCTAPFGAMLNASSVHARLLGENSYAYLNGLYCSIEDQHLSLRTVQEHNAPAAYSRTLYKGIIQDEAHTVYQGLIKVAPLANKTDAYLTNNNILLSDDARADSIPSLQINTNDVRCSHGSTTGKLSEEQIYYLQCRGYTREEARSVLTRAHFEPVLAGYPSVYVDKIDVILGRQLYK